jgi:hypothetical protein
MHFGSTVWGIIETVVTRSGVLTCSFAANQYAVVAKTAAVLLCCCTR